MEIEIDKIFAVSFLSYFLKNRIRQRFELYNPISIAVCILKVEHWDSNPIVPHLRNQGEDVICPYYSMYRMRA